MDSRNQSKANTFKKNECPICESNIKSAAYIVSSQKVYCYKCIYDYINSNGSCPESKMKVDLNLIKRIYF